jgi:dolichyl-phosphate-mannose-protein mannosyltransferase
MTSKPPRLHRAPGRETLVVIALTLLGAVIRLWSPGRLGMVHFDEGIYALAGLWSLSPRGLADFDTAIISYAPPGFPVLVGLSYLVFGVRDLAAILVSILAGTLTIPLSAWLSRRTFGQGAGGATAAFTALSGPHVAFSRMALTDASFLFCWLVAIGTGQRFLDRPNAARAFLLGLSVGLSQLFKYNAWISGAIVAGTALVWLLFSPGDWRTRSMAAIWGWGLLAAIVAALVYWPWFAFVDSHGGYAALLAHQRSYLGGFSSWPGHWSLQLAQEQFLSGGPVWVGSTGLVAAAAMAISTEDFAPGRRLLPRILVATAGLTALCLICGSSWWIALVWISVAITKSRGLSTKSSTLVCVGWTTLSVLTPFYHPYARLWLPIEAFGWLLMGGAFASIRSIVEVAGTGARWTWKSATDPLPWFTLFCVLLAVVSSNVQSRRQRMSVLGPSDSLRHAAQIILGELPQDIKALSAYARPPLAYYMALTGGVAVHRQPDLAHLLEPGGSASWALLDLALIRQQNSSELDLDRLLAGWTLVREIPTTLNPPTLLDIDPAAAREATIDTSAPLRLFRRKRTETIP